MSISAKALPDCDNLVVLSLGEVTQILDPDNYSIVRTIGNYEVFIVYQEEYLPTEPYHGYIVDMDDFKTYSARIRMSVNQSGDLNAIEVSS